MRRFNKISKKRWEDLRSVTDMVEVVGYQYGKRVVYYKVKAWKSDIWGNIRYSHVVINEDWWY